MKLAQVEEGQYRSLNNYFALVLCVWARLLRAGPGDNRSCLCACLLLCLQHVHGHRPDEVHTIR